jgi:hypothetical protein
MKSQRCVLLTLAICCATSAVVHAEEPHEKWLKYMVGDWEFVQGQDVGKSNIQKAGNVQGVIYRAEAENSDFAIIGVIGWDFQHKLLREHAFVNVNHRAIRTYTEITDDAIRGTQEYWAGNGAGFQKIEYRRISDDKMELVVTRPNGKSATVSFKRIKDVE